MMEECPLSNHLRLVRPRRNMRPEAEGPRKKCPYSLPFHWRSRSPSSLSHKRLEYAELGEVASKHPIRPPNREQF